MHYQALLVDVPHWAATKMDLGLYGDPDAPEWGRPVEPFGNVETYRTLNGDLALA